jgi:hypothetical protein
MMIDESERIWKESKRNEGAVLAFACVDLRKTTKSLSKTVLLKLAKLFHLRCKYKY